MKDKVVLDSSALLALLQEEKGAEIVKPLIGSSTMSSVNLSEVLIVLGRNGIDTIEAFKLIKDFIPHITIFDIEDAKDVALLKTKIKNKGLSFGDCACIALGIKLEATIYTADKIWDELTLENIKIKLIR